MGRKRCISFNLNIPNTEAFLILVHCKESPVSKYFCEMTDAFDNATLVEPLNIGGLQIHDCHIYDCFFTEMICQYEEASLFAFILFYLVFPAPALSLLLLRLVCLRNTFTFKVGAVVWFFTAGEESGWNDGLSHFVCVCVCVRVGGESVMVLVGGLQSLRR